MRVLEARKQVRQTAQKPAVYKSTSIPAPTLGLIANANIAQPPPGGAEVLENYLSTATGAILRRGSAIFSKVDTSDTIESLFAYVNGNNRSLFSATASAIYDISTPTIPYNFVSNTGDEMVTDAGDNLVFMPSASTAPTVTSLAGGEWVSVQFATSGGVFLRIVNGVDIPRVYDGTTWGVSPTITGIDSSKFSYVWSYKERLFFIEKDSLNAWYLPVGSVGGAAVILPLGAVFNLGGSLLFGGSWSLETGTGGLSEQCIFVTTEGQVAVFQGGDPSTAATWSRVGVYQIGKPLGKKAHFKAGGDIVIATDIGLIPLSQALQKDFAVLSPSAVSAQIETIWNKEVRERSSPAWSCLVWSSSQMAVVAPAVTSGKQPVLYVVNTRAGGWSKFTGWDVRCMIVFQDRLFFGSTNGLVAEANVTGQDMGRPYVGIYVPLFSDMASPGRKTFGMTKVITRSNYNPNEKVAMQRDYRISLPPAPEGQSVAIGNLWGSAVWGESKWGGSTVKTSFGTWKSTPQTGDVGAPSVQITSANIAPLDSEIVRTDVTFQDGEKLV